MVDVSFGVLLLLSGDVCMAAKALRNASGVHSFVPGVDPFESRLGVFAILGVSGLSGVVGVVL